jgi:hypothetical protein
MERKFNLCGLIAGVATYIGFMVVSMLAVYGAVHAARVLGWLN